MNLRPSGYEPDELPDCSTARRVRVGPQAEAPAGAVVATDIASANAVATVVESLALSRPQAGLFLRSDGRRSLALPAAADLRERIAQVHGLPLARSLIALEDTVVWGLVSPLAVSFPTRRYLHVAVNGRVVEAESFAPAVAKAYADLLPKGRHPAAFLRLELGPGEVHVRTCTLQRAP